MKALFQLITDPLGLPLDALSEYLILLIINVLAYFVVYKLVGELYDFGFISGSYVGHLIHWSLRIIIFIIIWAITYRFIEFVKIVIEIF